MKKRVLCIVLAVIVIASAVFFTIYNKYGNSYDYAEKDMSKYVPMITDKAFVEALYDGSVTLKEIEDYPEEVQYAIAAAFYDKNSDSNKKTSGEFGLYDTLNVNYFITTVIDGQTKVISLPKKMDVTNPTKVQIGADDVLARVMAALEGKSMSDTAFTTFTTGKLQAGDILYVDYTVKQGDSTEKSDTFYKVTVTGDNYMESIQAGLTAKFAEKFAEVEIGKAIDIAVNENLTVSLTVKFVARTVVKSGDILTGDTVFFTYTEQGSSDKSEYTAVIGTGDANMDADLGAGFAEKLKNLKIGVQREITVTVGESEKTYDVTVDYALPVDPTDTARDGFSAAEKFITFDYTYPDDSTEKAETDETVELKGKTVTVHAVVGSFYDVTYDYDGVINTLEYKPGETAPVDKYLTAYKAYKDAKKAYDDGAAKTGDDALSAEELQKLETAMNEAETAMNEAKTAYEAELGDGATTDPDKAAVAAYDKQTSDAVQDEYNEEYSYDVAEIIWNKLIEQTADAKLPSRAVRVAYNGLMDSYKQTYYTNKTKEPYSNYKNFKSYLTQNLYAGKDYKAEMMQEAREVVRANLVLYRLVEIYGTELDDTQKMMVNLYTQIGAASQAEALRSAGLFDNVMTSIVENINPAVKSAD